MSTVRKYIARCIGLSTLTTKPEASERFVAELRLVPLRLLQC